MAQAVVSPQLPFPPGPKGNFFLGSARELARSWPGHSERCARDYGDVVCYRFLHVPICQLTHPDYIEFVLVKHAVNFHKSRDYAAFKFFLGNGLLTNEGASWREERQLVGPAFSHENIAADAEVMADSGAWHFAQWEDGEEEVMTLFIAGHETTANALTWTWYLLSQNPEVEKKLAGELDSVLAGRAPALADLPRLPYTEMVLKESMRLYPPAWGVGRRALEDFEVGGYRIPAGTNVFMLQWVTHRDARFFPGPVRFGPARWTEGPIPKREMP